MSLKQKPPARTLAQLTDDELYQGIQYYEYKILSRSIFGLRMTERDKELCREWEGKIKVARAELERRKPKQEKLM